MTIEYVLEKYLTRFEKDVLSWVTELAFPSTCFMVVSAEQHLWRIIDSRIILRDRVNLDGWKNSSLGYSSPDAWGCYDCHRTACSGNLMAG